MKTEYFLFGEEICRILLEEEFEDVLEYARENNGYELVCFDEKMTGVELLSIYSGWNDYAFLDKEQYEQLLSI